MFSGIYTRSYFLVVNVLHKVHGGECIVLVLLSRTLLNREELEVEQKKQQIIYCRNKTRKLYYCRVFFINNIDLKSEGLTLF